MAKSWRDDEPRIFLHGVVRRRSPQTFLGVQMINIWKHFVFICVVGAVIISQASVSFQHSTLVHSHRHDLGLHVVWWTKWFGSSRFNEAMSEDMGCPFPTDLNVTLRPLSHEVWCRFSHNRVLSSGSPVLAFHARDLDFDDLPARQPEQLWVLMSQESPISDQSVEGFRPVRLNQFNLSMSYRLDSDIPFPYASPVHIVNALSQPMDDFYSRRSVAAGEATVLWLGSNCKALNSREVYIQELMKHIRVDSLGACLKTGAIRRPTSTLDIMRQYKFYLAIENSNCHDYVTEKLYNALQAGTVPIVSGPPGQDASGYKQFVPNDHSIIHLDKFPNPRDLAIFILNVEANKTLWDSYRRHRFSPAEFSDDFLQMWNRTQLDWGLCGLCRTAARVRFKPRYNKLLPMRHVEVDTSCLPNGSIARMMAVNITRHT